MAENQRRAILREIPDGGTMLEFGSGGSSVWLAKEMQEEGDGATLYSIEHDKQWFERMLEVRAARSLWNWLPLYRPVQHEGKNATPFEECPSGAASYLLNLPVCDVILVDGIARGACLATLAAMRFPGVVFLHDSNRDWYDWAVALYAKRTVLKATAGDYPPDLLRLEL